MFMQSTNRIVLLWLAGMVFANQARADELDYVPDNTSVVMSGKFQDYLKSKVSAEFKRMLNLIAPTGATEQDFEKEIANELGIPAANVARITMAVAFEKIGDREIGMVSTIKPITAASILAAKKQRSSFRKSLTYKEVKVGKHTVYEENYQFELFDGKDKEKKLSEVQQGEAFCVVESNLVVFGQLTPYAPKNEKPGPSQLRRVLERQGKPMLSAGIKAGLAHAPLSNSGTMVIDFQNFPRKQNLFGLLGLEALKEIEGKLDVLTVTINDKEKLTAKVTLVCKDAATAAVVKKHADARLVDLRAMMKKAAKAELPKGQEEFRQAAEKVLDAITTSVSGNQAIAAAAAPPEEGVRFLFGFLFLAERKASSDEKKNEPAK